VHSFAVEDRRVPGIDYVFYKVGGTVHLSVVGEAVGVIRRTLVSGLIVSFAFVIYFFIGSQLEELPTLSDQLKPRIHLLGD